MLKSLFINGDKFRPTIDFNLNNNELSISGKILVENSKELFTPIRNWVEKHNESITKKTTLVIDLIYYNTSAFKELLSFMYDITQTNPNCVIVWKYDSDDDVSLEDAEELQDILGKERFSYLKK